MNSDFGSNYQRLSQGRLLRGALFMSPADGAQIAVLSRFYNAMDKLYQTANKMRETGDFRP
jgi:hypothetical protein